MSDSKSNTNGPLNPFRYPGAQTAPVSVPPTSPPSPTYEPRHWDLANRIMIAALIESKGIDAGPAIRHRFAQVLKEAEDRGRNMGWPGWEVHDEEVKPRQGWWQRFLDWFEGNGELS